MIVFNSFAFLSESTFNSRSTSVAFEGIDVEDDDRRCLRISSCFNAISLTDCADTRWRGSLDINFLKVSAISGCNSSMCVISFSLNQARGFSELEPTSNISFQNISDTRAPRETSSDLMVFGSSFSLGRVSYKTSRRFITGCCFDPLAILFLLLLAFISSLSNALISPCGEINNLEGLTPPEQKPRSCSFARIAAVLANT
mmetsp:Transcript_1785/g.5666  ORF Transcript_1785/g.5666 Transcript_1785/m.5666 type:complete len:200 (+) Transcript_1785:1662-2261(+)